MDPGASDHVQCDLGPGLRSLDSQLIGKRALSLGKPCGPCRRSHPGSASLVMLSAEPLSPCQREAHDVQASTCPFRGFVRNSQAEEEGGDVAGFCVAPGSLDKLTGHLPLLLPALRWAGSCDPSFLPPTPRGPSPPPLITGLSLQKSLFPVGLSCPRTDAN